MGYRVLFNEDEKCIIIHTSTPFISCSSYGTALKVQRKMKRNMSIKQIHREISRKAKEE